MQYCYFKAFKIYYQFKVCHRCTCNKIGLWKSLFSIANMFLRKREVSTFEVIKTILTLPMRCSNIDFSDKKKKIELEC